MKFLFIISLITNSAFSMVDTLDWKSLDQLETKLQAWVKEAGDEDLKKLSRIDQWPTELVWTKSLFPELLPEGFLGRNIDMNCSPDFQNYRNKKDKKSFTSWKQCIESLYRSNPPLPIKKALEGLIPVDNKK